MKRAEKEIKVNKQQYKTITSHEVLHQASFFLSKGLCRKQARLSEGF